MAKQWKGKKRTLMIDEMVDLEGIYWLGQKKNVLRLWRYFHGMTQGDVAEGLGVTPMRICTLERWGMSGFSEKYLPDLHKIIDELGKRGITPAMLGLQYEGLETRFSKTKVLNRRQQSEVCGEEFPDEE